MMLITITVATFALAFAGCGANAEEESFKQDFSKWESLKKNLLVALDQTESQLSDQLRARENRERLNAGRHDAVSESYRQLVDRYYQSLAAPRKPNR